MFLHFAESHESQLCILSVRNNTRIEQKVSFFFQVFILHYPSFRGRRPSRDYKLPWGAQLSLPPPFYHRTLCAVPS